MRSFRKPAALLTAAVLVFAAVCTAAFIPSVSAQDSVPVGFPDVYPEDWFYSDVTKLTSLGILSGYPDGLFRPDDDITNAEFIKILMMSAGFDLNAEPVCSLFSDHWAARYLSLAYDHGILTDRDLNAGFSPDVPITRSAMIRMMILALGIEPARIDDPFTDISDIYASTAYNEYLLRGYLQEDGTRLYNGMSSATRSEASAIAVRVMEYREDSYEYRKKAILENASQNALNNESELIHLFYILNREFIPEFTFETTLDPDTWTSYYQHSNIINLEYFYSSGILCRIYNGSSLCTVSLKFEEDVETVKAYHAVTEAKADKIIASILTDGMTDKDKVKAIHDYLILNCEYNYNDYLKGEVPFESRIAYGALCERSAVCQGYSAAFNMLCKRAGIRSAVVTGTVPDSEDLHAWNMILTDGQIFYIDVTRDDPVPDQKGKISYKYFLLTESELSSLGYVWDKSDSNLKYFY